MSLNKDIKTLPFTDEQGTVPDSENSQFSTHILEKINSKYGRNF